MPIYEYACRSCGKSFEKLTFRRETPACPECDGTEVERQLSTFAVAGGASTPAPRPAGCGTCGDPRGPGACQLD